MPTKLEFGSGTLFCPASLYPHAAIEPSARSPIRREPEPNSPEAAIAANPEFGAGTLQTSHQQLPQPTTDPSALRPTLASWLAATATKFAFGAGTLHAVEPSQLPHAAIEPSARSARACEVPAATATSGPLGAGVRSNAPHRTAVPSALSPTALWRRTEMAVYPGSSPG